MLSSYTWKCLCAGAFSEPPSSPLAFLLTPRNTQSSVWAAKYIVFDCNFKVPLFIYALFSTKTPSACSWKVSLRCQHPLWCHKRTDLLDSAFRNPAIVIQGCFPASFQNPHSHRHYPSLVKSAFCRRQLCLTCELLSSPWSTKHHCKLFPCPPVAAAAVPAGCHPGCGIVSEEQQRCERSVTVNHYPALICENKISQTRLTSNINIYMVVCFPTNESLFLKKEEKRR